MTSQELLEKLNEECKHCIEEKFRNFERHDPMMCATFCEIGRRVHALEEGWDGVDWNTARYGPLYRH